jgi:hypothetical protein
MKSEFCLPITLAALLAAAPVSAQTVVPLRPFDSVELEGGGHVVLRYGKVQQVRLLRGSTAFTRFVVDQPGKLRIEACDDDCPRHYDLEVDIAAPRINALAISGGGAIDGAGGFPPARKLALAVEGGGTIDARELDCHMATAAVNGGGLIRLKADDQLTAVINGGGKIRYWGNPRVTQAIDGGGRVERGE